MRNGVNPEKYKNELLPEFFHRVIVPVYIPNLEEEYYCNLKEVFETFLKNLVKTINPRTTAITVIDNNSCEAISDLIDNYRAQIDKIIVFNENKGKVFPVLQEARCAIEPFVTITDADVLFYQGWEQAIFEIFANCPKAGVVAPLPSPSLAFYENTAVFADRYLFGNIAYEKKMLDADADRYLEGMGNDSLLNRENHKYSWKQRQYVLKETNAIIGCGHFVATYRTALFKGEDRYPSLKFKNGLERTYIDSLANKKGYYRLSTVKTYAYHMANNIDVHSKSFNQDSGNWVEAQLLQKGLISKKSQLPLKLRSLIFRVLKRLYKL